MEGLTVTMPNTPLKASACAPVLADAEFAAAAAVPHVFFAAWLASQVLVN